MENNSKGAPASAPPPLRLPPTARGPPLGPGPLVGGGLFFWRFLLPLLAVARTWLAWRAMAPRRRFWTRRGGQPWRLEPRRRARAAREACRRGYRGVTDGKARGTEGQGPPKARAASGRPPQRCSSRYPRSSAPDAGRSCSHRSWASRARTLAARRNLRTPSASVSRWPC